MSGDYTIEVKLSPFDLCEQIWLSSTYDEAIDLVLELDEYYGDSEFTDRLFKALKKRRKETRD